MQGSSERPPLASFIVRETPWKFAIIEIVPDLRGITYVSTIAAGAKYEMENEYESRYGKRYEWAEELVSREERRQRERPTLTAPSPRAFGARGSGFRAMPTDGKTAEYEDN